VAVNPAELLSAERSDLSNFLIHLTKNGSYEVYEDYPYIEGHYKFRNSSNLQADDSLIKILSSDTPTLQARAPFGHFKYDISIYTKARRAVPLEWLQCACFSETPLRELRSFYLATQQSKNIAYKKNKYQKYGIAFFTDFIRNKGGHPVLYFDSRNDKIYQNVDRLADPEFLPTCEPLLPLFESFGPARRSKSRLATNEIDFRWEREWRHVGDIAFELKDVAFGLCPQDRIPEFEKLSKGFFPFIDPDWSQENLYKYLKSKGRDDLAEAI
jgi:hypothetical protein